MSQKFAQATIIEGDSQETWNINLGESTEYKRGNNGALVKKESRQEIDDKKGAQEWVEPRFPVDQILDLMDINVWHNRCIRLKSKLTTGLGYRLVHAEDPDAQPDAKYDEIMAWLKKPNDRHAQETFQWMMDKFTIDYNALGNAYLEASLRRDRILKELYHVRSETMRRARKLRTNGYYQIIEVIKKVHFNAFGDEERNPAKTDIIHYMDYDPRDDYYGIPGWYPALADMLMERSNVEYMINTFRNQLVAKFMVVIEGGKLSKDAKESLRAFLKNNAMGSKKAGTTLVLDTDDPNVKIRIEKLEVSFGEKGNYFKENRADARDHIIAAHGVLPRLVGVMQSGQLGGGSESNAQLKTFYEIEILPEQKRIEDLLNNTVFSSFGDDNPWRIDFVEMDTSDEQQLAESITKLVGQPVMDVNEGRERLNLQKLDQSGLRQLEARQTSSQIETLRKSIESLEKY